MIIKHAKTLQTSVGAKVHEEEVKKKRSETKSSGASCFAICHCHGCTWDLLKQLSGKVLEIILDCFHSLAPDSSLGIPAQSEFVVAEWLTDSFISHECRRIKLPSLSSLFTKVFKT